MHPLPNACGKLSSVIPREGDTWLSATQTVVFTFTVSENLHAATEHSFEHSVLFGQGLHCSVVESAAYVQLHILGTGTGPFERGGAGGGCWHC